MRDLVTANSSQDQPVRWLLFHDDVAGTPEFLRSGQYRWLIVAAKNSKNSEDQFEEWMLALDART
jgi:hypothetical protein